jgi:dephospho-CoA kinase
MEPGYGADVLRVGLTGTLGAGKTTVGKALAARGAVVIDADQVARDVTAPGSPGELALLEHFGDRAAASPGPGGGTKHLDRSALADIVFSDASKRLALEAITHPLIRAEVLRRAALADNVAVAHNGVVVIEIPLLDERRKVDYRLDVVVLVDTPDDLAVQRAMGRGMTEPAARARSGVRWPTAPLRTTGAWTTSKTLSTSCGAGWCRRAHPAQPEGRPAFDAHRDIVTGPRYHGGRASVRSGVRVVTRR